MAIVDAEVCERAGWTPVELAAACLKGGACLLQLRAKQVESGRLLEVATVLVESAHAAGALVIVNDRADIARLSGADGVHVGQQDLDPASVRALVGPDAVVGLSTHTAGQVEAAVHQPVSYVAIGPVFDTATKATGHDAVGLEGVRRAAERLRPWHLPLVAIGGITVDSAARVIAAGASSVAVIADLVATGDPEARVRQFLKALGPPAGP